MVQPSPEAVDTTPPTTVEVDRRKYEALLGAQRELAITQTVLAVVAEQLMQQTGAEAIVLSDEQVQHAPDLHATRNDAAKEVTVTVFR